MFSIKILFGQLKKLGKLAKDAALKLLKNLWKKVPFALKAKLGIAAFFAVLVIGVIGFFMSVPNLISDFFDGLSKSITTYMIDNNLFEAKIEDLITLNDSKKFEKELIDKGIEVVSTGFRDETKYDGSVGNGKYINYDQDQKLEASYSYLKKILVADLATYCLKDKGGIINIDLNSNIDVKSNYLEKTLTITNNTQSNFFAKLLFNDKVSTTYNMEGWTGKYGLSKNFLIALHLSTLAPDFVASIIDEVLPECEVNLKTYDIPYTIETYEADSDGKWDKNNPIDSDFSKSNINISMPYVDSAKNWYKTFDFTDCYEYVQSPEIRYYKYDRAKNTLEEIVPSSDETTVEEEGKNANKYSDLVNNLSSSEKSTRKGILDEKDEHTGIDNNHIIHAWELENTDSGTSYFKCTEVEEGTSKADAANESSEYKFGEHTHKLGIISEGDEDYPDHAGEYKCAICDEIVESQILILKQTLKGYYIQTKEPEVKKIKDIVEENKKKYNLDNRDKILEEVDALQGYQQSLNYKENYDSNHLEYWKKGIEHWFEHLNLQEVNENIVVDGNNLTKYYKDGFGNMMIHYDGEYAYRYVVYSGESNIYKIINENSPNTYLIYTLDPSQSNGINASLQIMYNGINCKELYYALNHNDSSYDYEKAYKAFGIDSSSENAKTELNKENMIFINTVFYSYTNSGVNLGTDNDPILDATTGNNILVNKGDSTKHGYVCRICAFCTGPDVWYNISNTTAQQALKDNQLIASHKMFLEKNGNSWTCMVCKNPVSEEVAKNVPDDCKIDLSNVSEDANLRYTFKELFDRQYILYDGTIKTYFERTQEGTDYIKVAKTLPLAFSILETSDNAEDQIILRDLKEFMADEGFYYSDSLYDTSSKLKTTFRWIMPNCMPNTQWPSSSDIDGTDNLIDGNLFAGKSKEDLQVIAPADANIIKASKDAIALRFTSGLSKDMTMIISGIDVNSSLKATNSDENNYGANVNTQIQENYNELTSSGNLNGGTSFVNQGDIIGYAISGTDVRIRILNQNGEKVIPSNYMTTIDLTAYDYVLTGGYYYPSFEQFTGEWANKPFRKNDPDSTIESSGCGATSFAMIASGLTYSVITPDQVANYMPESTKIGGSSYAGFKAAGDILGLKVERKETNSTGAAYVRKIIQQETSQGRAVIAHMTEHFFVILPSQENIKEQVYVLDPYNILKDGEYTPEEMEKALNNRQKPKKLGTAYHVISK